MVDNKEHKLARMESRESDSLSTREYNGVLGCTVLYGLVMTAFLSKISGDLFYNMNPIIFLILYFVLALLGSYIAYSSDSVITSFIGYNLVVLPIGALMSICLRQYSNMHITQAFIMTAITTAAMLAISTIKPEWFIGMGRTLFTALAVGLIVEIVAMIFGVYSSVFDWAFVIIFTLYIGYDWSVAQSYPKTLNNAVDSALDIYLDIINLFIRLLSIYSSKDD